MLDVIAIVMFRMALTSFGTSQVQPASRRGDDELWYRRCCRGRTQASVHLQISRSRY